MFQLLNTEAYRKGLGLSILVALRICLQRNNHKLNRNPLHGQGSTRVAVRKQTQNVQQVTQGNAFYSSDFALSNGWSAVLMRQLLRRTWIGSA